MTEGKQGSIREGWRAGKLTSLPSIKHRDLPTSWVERER